MGETICPVCGFELEEPAWSGDAGSQEMCPSCGIQFGYDDAGGRQDPARLRQIHALWRRAWKRCGMLWSSRGRRPPFDWNPHVFLDRVEGCG
jgi:hypothetical protein